MARVRPFRPDFDAAYAVRPGDDLSAWRLEMFTIAPWPASIRCGIAARQSHIGAVRFTRRLASHADVDRSPTALSDSSTVLATALFTSTDSPPRATAAAPTRSVHVVS